MILIKQIYKLIKFNKTSLEVKNIKDNNSEKIWELWDRIIEVESFFESNREYQWAGADAIQKLRVFVKDRDIKHKLMLEEYW